jgi:hypothetical protein
MDEREQKALSNVIKYLWNDERKHFECEPSDDHIFRSLQVLEKYLGLGWS